MIGETIHCAAHVDVPSINTVVCSVYKLWCTVVLYSVVYNGSVVYKLWCTVGLYSVVYLGL